MLQFVSGLTTLHRAPFFPLRCVKVAADFGVIRNQVAEQNQSNLTLLIQQRVRQRVNELFEERFADFEENDLPGALGLAIAQVLRFDLATEEMVARQRAGVLILDGVEVIVRRNVNGTITPYYRDHPDGDPRDNLLSLEHYSPPYEPPA